MTEIQPKLDELQIIANSIIEIVKSLAVLFDSKGSVVKKTQKQLTLEEVRAVLAEKSQDGFTGEVRALLEKYGAKRLSEIDPANYQALLSDAEALSNE